jgi:D-alanine-D-alanine ligase
MLCANSDAYACALTLHKFHCFALLHDLGVDAPQTWHFRPDAGWIGPTPTPGTKVIAKSTFEAWSVGVTDDSVFVVDDSCDERIEAIADSIGQPVTVQEFVSGAEVHVPVISCPERIVAPPVEVILSKAPGDGDAVMTIDDNLGEGGVTYRRFEGHDEVVERVRARALEVFELLGLEGFTRVDFRVTPGGRPRVFDVAVSPGLESYCSGATSLGHFGLDHPSYMRAVVAATLGARGLLAATATTRSRAAKTRGRAAPIAARTPADGR